MVEFNGKDSSELMLDAHVRASSSANCVVMIVTDDGKGGLLRSQPELKCVKSSLGDVQVAWIDCSMSSDESITSIEDSEVNWPERTEPIMLKQSATQ